VCGFRRVWVRVWSRVASHWRHHQASVQHVLRALSRPEASCSIRVPLYASSSTCGDTGNQCCAVITDRPPSHHGRYDLHQAPLPKHNAHPALRPCSTCVCLASREHACTSRTTRTLNTPLSHVRLRSHKLLVSVPGCRWAIAVCAICRRRFKEAQDPPFAQVSASRQQCRT
jgi:hypothetical protein